MPVIQGAKIMSNVAFVYSQPTSRDLTSFINSHWHVHENEDENGESLPDLLALTDLVNDRLSKAEALSWTLHRANQCHDSYGSVTALVIAELIHEALEAHEKLWDSIRQVAKQK